ncbi:MAG: hypothetical protein ACW96X_01060 [Promethearchaeota archaeon]|jgi:hypothetical protein
MINTEENSQNIKDSSKDLQIQGVCILEMSMNGEIEVIFQKGIDIALVHHIINMNRNRILSNEEGDIKDYVGSLNAYLVYCNKNQSDKIIALFVDKEEVILNYSKLDSLTEILFEKIGITTTNLEIKKICINPVKFLKAKGLVGFLALNKTGILYFSRVKKNRKKISKNIFQIAGFISAILIYSKDLISGEDPELRLEDINLGSHHFYVNIKNNVVFAYFIEKHKVTENFDKYIQLVIEKFVEKYYNPYITNFKGDLSPFHGFDSVIDQYFEI